MWGVPGSHKQGVTSYMKRKRDETGKLVTYLEPSNEKVDYNTQGAVPLEVPPGSIVLLDGNFLHWSY